MLFQSYRPGPPLSRFVDSFWLYKSGPQLHARERGLPSGAPELVIDLGSGGPSRREAHHPSYSCCVPGTVLCGARTRSFKIETDRSLWMLMVRFKPGGAYPFFAQPAHELRDKTVRLESLWDAKASELWERLMETSTVAAQFDVLEQALLAQVVRPLERHPAVAFALREFTAVPQERTIAQVADQVALSHGHFIQVFRAEVGLTPKQFCRIHRFVEVLRRTRKGERAAWAQLAQTCGYYDQAHLSNDFHALAGVSPSVYLRDRSTQFPTHLILRS